MLCVSSVTFCLVQTLTGKLKNHNLYYIKGFLFVNRKRQEKGFHRTLKHKSITLLYEHIRDPAHHNVYGH